MWCDKKNQEIGLTRGPEGVLADTKGSCWVENAEGRVWEMKIGEAVKSDGLPIPPLLPSLPPQPPPKQLQDKENKEIGANEEAENDKKRVKKEKSGEGEDVITDAKGKDEWKAKFTKVIGTIKFANGFKALMRIGKKWGRGKKAPAKPKQVQL